MLTYLNDSSYTSEGLSRFRAAAPPPPKPELVFGDSISEQSRSNIFLSKDYLDLHGVGLHHS